jgi:hypothetical protein
VECETYTFLVDMLNVTNIFEISWQHLKKLNRNIILCRFPLPGICFREIKHVCHFHANVKSSIIATQMAIN